MMRSSVTENVYSESDGGQGKSRLVAVILTSATAMTTFYVTLAPQTGLVQPVGRSSSVYRVDELPRAAAAEQEEGFDGISLVDDQEIYTYLSQHQDVRRELGVAAEAIASLVGERRPLELELFVDPEEGVSRAALTIDLRHVDVDVELEIMEKIYINWLHPVSAKIGVGKISIRAA